jgi:enoyl-CoA hydratase/carnithine racemase
MGETTEDSVIARRDGRVGRIVLNRSRALNALDLGMIRRIAIALDGWRDVPEVHAVVIESASDRAFCAGGDIRAVRQMSLSDDHQGIETFFTEEYAVNRAIAEYPKPIVALVDGICMGGGIGLSVHGQARVATERAVFAMPETAIALFPDIGATYLLPRLPGALGVYLALTGARMEAADAVHAGLATHFVPRERLPALSAALAAEGVAVLAGFAAPLPPFRLRAERPAIDRCFAAPSLSGIVAALAAEGSEWAAATLATLRLMSPSSLAWSLEIVRAGAHRTLPQCLAAELALTRHATRHPDFLEGVRAMVVDKDRTPRWSPETIEQLTGG